MHSPQQRKTRIVVVGGGYAGVTCAVRLARRRDLDVLVINADAQFRERIRMHQVLAGQKLKSRPLARLLARSGARFLLDTVTSIDLQRRTLSCSGSKIAFDYLVLATGSSAVASLRGARDNAISLTPASVSAAADRIRDLAARNARVLIVGTGLTAVETAAELAQSYPSLRVELIGQSELLRNWPQEARDYARRALLGFGVHIHPPRQVLAIEPGAVRTRQGLVPFDLCIGAAGFTFGTLARSAGLLVSEAGQVVVDSRLRSISHPHVYAIGDATRPVLDPGDPLPMGCKSAIPLGAHCAENLLARIDGRAEVPFDYALPFFCLSLGRRDGIIQWPQRTEQPARRIIGRLAALFKELVCKSTYWALELEARGVRAAIWERTGRVEPLAADIEERPAA